MLDRQCKTLENGILEVIVV